MLELPPFSSINIFWITGPLTVLDSRAVKRKHYLFQRWRLTPGGLARLPPITSVHGQWGAVSGPTIWPLTVLALWAAGGNLGEFGGDLGRTMAICKQTSLTLSTQTVRLITFQERRKYGLLLLLHGWKLPCIAVAWVIWLYVTAACVILLHDAAAWAILLYVTAAWAILLYVVVILLYAAAAWAILLYVVVIVLYVAAAWAYNNIAVPYATYITIWNANFHALCFHG